jgi:ribosomal protein L44E
MPEHYTKATLGVTRWCNQCQRHTAHRVREGRAAECTEHERPNLTKKQIEQRAREAKRARQPELFPT